MPTVARTFSLTYGSVTIGGSSSTELHIPILLDTSYGRLIIEVHALIVQASESAFNTECDALEAAFRVPRQDISLDFGSTPKAWSEANNTAFNVTPSIRIDTGSEKNTGLSREYICRIEAELPADLSGENGLASLRVTETLLETKQRRVEFSGDYTALGGNLARAQFDAQIDALRTATLAAVDSSATWVRVVAPSTNDTKDQHLSFSEIHEEVLDSVTDDDDAAGIVKPSTIVQTSRASPGDFGAAGVERPIIVQVGFSCGVDKTVTTNLKALYEGTIFGAMIAKAKAAVTNPGSVAVLDHRPSLDPATNRISATMLLKMSGGRLILELQQIERYGGTKGVVPIPAHSNNPHAKYLLRGAAVLERFLITAGRMLGDENDAHAYLDREEDIRSQPTGSVLRGGGSIPDGVLKAQDIPPSGASGGQFIEIEQPQREIVPVSVGILPDVYTETKFVEVVPSLYVVEPSGSGAPSPNTGIG